LWRRATLHHFTPPASPSSTHGRRRPERPAASRLIPVIAVGLDVARKRTFGGWGARPHPTIPVKSNTLAG
jgi:hypothetical protein